MSGALTWMLSRCLIKMVRVARFSCRFFLAMAGNKAKGKIQALIGSLMVLNIEKGEFFRVEKKNTISRCE